MQTRIQLTFKIAMAKRAFIFYLQGGKELIHQHPFRQTIPFHKKSVQNQIEIFKLLINRGASVGIYPKQGLSILHWACFNDNFDLVQEIVENDPNLILTQDSKGLYPIDMIYLQNKKQEKKMNQKKIMTFLISHFIVQNHTIIASKSKLDLLARQNTPHVRDHNALRSFKFNKNTTQAFYSQKKIFKNSLFYDETPQINRDYNSTSHQKLSIIPESDSNQQFSIFSEKEFKICSFPDEEKSLSFEKNSLNKFHLENLSVLNQVQEEKYIEKQKKSQDIVIIESPQQLENKLEDQKVTIDLIIINQNWNLYSDEVTFTQDHFLKAKVFTECSKLSALQKYELRMMYWAAYTGQPQIVTLLLCQNTNPFIIDYNGQSPFHAACETGQYEVNFILIIQRFQT